LSSASLSIKWKLIWKLKRLAHGKSICDDMLLCINKDYSLTNSNLISFRCLCYNAYNLCIFIGYDEFMFAKVMSVWLCFSSTGKECSNGYLWSIQVIYLTPAKKERFIREVTCLVTITVPVHESIEWHKITKH
jgi:hypothetical protein